MEVLLRSETEIIFLMKKKYKKCYSYFNMLKNNSLVVYVSMVAAMIFWGFSFIWSKQVMEFYRPITVIMFRLFLSGLFLFAVGFISGKLKKIHRSDYKSLIIITFFEPFLYFIGENIGLSLVSSTIAAVVIATIPLFTPVAGYFILKERLTKTNLAGIILSVCGVVLVILKSDFSLAVSPLGLLMLGLAVFSAVGYSIVAMRLAGKYNVLSIITYQNSLGALFFVPLFFIWDAKYTFAVGFVLEAILPLVQLSVFASSIAFILFTYGLFKLGVSKANTFSNIIPVFTAIFSYFIFNEQLTIQNMVGIAVVIGGLFLSQIKFRSFKTKTKRIEATQQLLDKAV